MAKEAGRAELRLASQPDDRSLVGELGEVPEHLREVLENARVPLVPRATEREDDLGLSMRAETVRHEGPARDRSGPERKLVREDGDADRARDRDAMWERRQRRALATPPPEESIEEPHGALQVLR